MTCISRFFLLFISGWNVNSYGYMPHLMFLNPWYSGQQQQQQQQQQHGPGPGHEQQTLDAEGNKILGSPSLLKRMKPPPPPPPMPPPSTNGGQPRSLESSTSSSGSNVSNGLHFESTLSESQRRHLNGLRNGLRPGWTVHVTPDGRFYYCK